MDAIPALLPALHPAESNSGSNQQQQTTQPLSSCRSSVELLLLLKNLPCASLLLGTLFYDPTSDTTPSLIPIQLWTDDLQRENIHELPLSRSFDNAKACRLQARSFFQLDPDPILI